MSLEERLGTWIGPSSPTEQDKQERTERMIQEAVEEHPAFDGCALSVYAKGSYANNTNVRADSDVDIAVECTEVEYWDEATSGARPPGTPYKGIWTPERLRSELEKALRSKFSGQVDSTGSIAIQVHSGTARVDADVVPCFSYRYYMTSGSREGTRIFARTGPSIDNYPAQQLSNGRAKNLATNLCFKKVVRILKRVANAMEGAGKHRCVPSFFVECLAYNCPDGILCQPTWEKTIRSVLIHVWTELQGPEPADDEHRWVEVNECFYLFHPEQKWSRADGHEFAAAAWGYLGLS